MGKKVAPERDRRINHEMKDLGFRISLYNGKLYWKHDQTGQRIRLKNADRWLRSYYEKNQPEREEQRDEVLHLL